MHAARLFQHSGAVGRVGSTWAGAVLSLLELTGLAEVFRGAGIVAAICEGFGRAVVRVPGIRAERCAIVGRAARRVHLRLPAEVTHRRPALRATTVTKGAAFDQERVKAEPARHIVRV